MAHAALPSTSDRPPGLLQAGQRAPLFSLPDADMETVELVQFYGKMNVVLYFYPKNGTPACTLQATDFSDHEDEFARHDCVVMGVSLDDCLSHAEFRDQHGVSIRLLADTESEVCKQYGVIHQKDDGNGGKKACITRSTFIIDKNGVVRHAFHVPNPRGHAAEVLNLVKSLV